LWVKEQPTIFVKIGSKKSWVTSQPSCRKRKLNRRLMRTELCGDQIRGVLLDPQGNPGPSCDLLDAAGDVEGIGLAPLKDGGCLLVWAEQRERNWDLYGRP
jgi:hypothetical protein